VRVVFDRAGADGAPRAHIALPGGRGIPTILEGLSAMSRGDRPARPVASAAPAVHAFAAGGIMTESGPRTAPRSLATTRADARRSTPLRIAPRAVRPAAFAPLASPALAAPPVFAAGITAAAQAPAPALTAPAVPDAAPRDDGRPTTGSLPTRGRGAAPALSLALSLAPLAAAAAPVQAPEAPRVAVPFAPLKITAPAIVGGPQAIAGPARVTPLLNFAGFFADGGVIPPGKWGIAGENGPEAIVNAGAAGDFGAPTRNAPQTARGESSSQGGAPGHVFNFHFPPGTDARSFQQSEGQISAMLVRAAARGRRNT
jgi:hypothetical protein